MKRVKDQGKANAVSRDVHRRRWHKHAVIKVPVEQIAKEERVSEGTVLRSIGLIENYNAVVNNEVMLQKEAEIVLDLAPLQAGAIRDALRAEGWKWLLYEVAAMIVFSLLSMGLDRLRSLQKEKAAATIPPEEKPNPPAPFPEREGGE